LRTLRQKRKECSTVLETSKTTQLQKQLPQVASSAAMSSTAATSLTFFKGAPPAGSVARRDIYGAIIVGHLWCG
jgi:hypothetical protein